jgi:hypothetical protein
MVISEAEPITSPSYSRGLRCVLRHTGAQPAEYIYVLPPRLPAAECMACVVIMQQEGQCVIFFFVIRISVNFFKPFLKQRKFDKTIGELRVVNKKFHLFTDN